jgi:hypothetical protein
VKLAAAGTPSSPSTARTKPRLSASTFDTAIVLPLLTTRSGRASVRVDKSKVDHRQDQQPGPRMDREDHRKRTTPGEHR